MSLFGESDTDKRDFSMGLAGLLAGIQSLRILAERGIASVEDIRTAQKGVGDVIATIPAGEMSTAHREQIDEMFDKIAATAAITFGPRKN